MKYLMTLAWLAYYDLSAVLRLTGLSSVEIFPEGGLYPAPCPSVFMYNITVWKLEIFREIVPRKENKRYYPLGGETAVGNCPVENCKHFWMESIVERGKKMN